MYSSVIFVPGLEIILGCWTFMRPVSGLRVPAVGGNAGLEYLNVNNGVSTANANYGSPLNFLARPVVSALP